MGILEVEDLRAYFFTRRGVVKAVDGLSFELREGEVLCLVGESGSGKTAAALSILGLLDQPGRIVSGVMRWHGNDLREYSKEQLRKIRGKDIAMIFQDPKESLNPVFTIGDQITEQMKLHIGLSGKEAMERAVILLEKVGIPEAGKRLDDYPHQFSGGMNQRVMIAMALSCDPELLIADEPTSALDVTTQAQFLRLLMSLKKERGMSLVFITHDLGIVAEIADRVVVMYAGKVMERGDVFQIFENPRHPYTLGLLNCLPNVREGRRELSPIPGVIPSLIKPPKGCIFHTRCIFAKRICSKEAPNENLVEPRHTSACHFWNSKEVKIASEAASIE